MNTSLDNKSHTNENWIDRLKLAIMIVAVYIILIFLGAGCPIKYLTGVSCPGCGMTRAVLSLMQLKFREAFYYHPLFALIPFMFALYLFEDKLKPIQVKSFWTAIVVVFLTVYIFRLLSTSNSIVSIDISSGFVLKFIQNNILGG